LDRFFLIYVANRAMQFHPNACVGKNQLWTYPPNAYGMLDAEESMELQGPIFHSSNKVMLNFYVRELLRKF